MSISIEKIVQSIKSVKGQNVDKIDVANLSANIDNADGQFTLDLSEEEKSVLLMLEAANFFEKNTNSSSLETIKKSSEFICDNISELFARAKENKNDDSVTPCPSCGAVGIAGAAFCYNCGTKISANKSVFVKFSTTKWRNKFFEVAKIPGFEISLTPITQDVWNQVMKFNPSYFKGAENPVDQISWYDAIYFCNSLSALCGYSPCYFVDGSDDVRNWGFSPERKDREIKGNIKCNFHANGFRLPTVSEWLTAASSRDDFDFAGSDKAEDVAWFRDNSDETTHPVSEKKPNGFGLYDMSGNVYEWCWDSFGVERNFCGGSWKSRSESCENNCVRSLEPSERLKLMGMRVVRSL